MVTINGDAIWVELVSRERNAQGDLAWSWIAYIKHGPSIHLSGEFASEKKARQAAKKGFNRPHLRNGVTPEEADEMVRNLIETELVEDVSGK